MAPAQVGPTSPRQRRKSVLEHKGDEVIREIFARLNQTFITPLDPEDIHNISTALDNVLDGIEDTAHCMVAYRIGPMPFPLVVLF